MTSREAIAQAGYEATTRRPWASAPWSEQVRWRLAAKAIALVGAAPLFERIRDLQKEAREVELYTVEFYLREAGNHAENAHLAKATKP